MPTPTEIPSLAILEDTYGSAFVSTSQKRIPNPEYCYTVDFVGYMHQCARFYDLVKQVAQASPAFIDRASTTVDGVYRWTMIVTLQPGAPRILRSRLGSGWLSHGVSQITKTEYKSYRCLDHWKETCREQIEAAQNKCERCSMPRWLAEIVYGQDLHVRHKSYANLGYERPEELEVLCIHCHDIESFGSSKLPLLKPQTCSLCTDNHWDKRNEFCAPCHSLLEGPNFYWLLSRKHPTLDCRMLEYFAKDIVLEAFHDDGGIALLNLVQKGIQTLRNGQVFF